MRLSERPVVSRSVSIWSAESGRENITASAELRTLSASLSRVFVQDVAVNKVNASRMMIGENK